jgi:hypothetical protein
MNGLTRKLRPSKDQEWSALGPQVSVGGSVSDDPGSPQLSPWGHSYGEEVTLCPLVICNVTVSGVSSEPGLTRLGDPYKWVFAPHGDQDQDEAV